MTARIVLFIGILIVLLTGCARVDLNMPMPQFDTGIDPNTWVRIPAGEFYWGQFDELIRMDEDYEMMVTQVTVSQYAAYLTEALAAGAVHIADDAVRGYYPGDPFLGVKHEVEIPAGDYVHIPLTDASLRLVFDGTTFTPQAGYESHPMTMVTWFGANAYCQYFGWRLPGEKEWEKAARGLAEGSTHGRPYPWGDEITRQDANFYVSRDPFEDMRSVGSRTSPVGFYNGQTYAGFTTRNNASPFGLYDMAGNAWQWTADIYDGQHFRYMRGGSKDTYEMDLRVWVRNNALPHYFSPGVGFRCAR